MEPSDSELVSRTISGSGSAFDALVSRYRTRVYYLVLSKVGDRETALDLAQEAFIRAYMSLGVLREPAKFPSWVASIAVNLCKMSLRKSTEVLLPMESLESLSVQEHNRTRIDTDVIVVHEAISKLPDGTRAAALLYFAEEMKMSEVADFLGISLAAVKSRIRDARKRLQKEMIDMVRSQVKKGQPTKDFNKSLERKLELARWYREFADLINSGVTIMTTLEKLKEGDFSESVRDATAKLADAILAGSTMSDALANLPALTTSHVVGMVRAGEVGGILDWTTRFLADWIEIENSQRQIELVFWLRAVGSVISAGAFASHALSCTFDMTRTEEVHSAAREMIEAVDSGQSLEAVVTRRSDVFPPIVMVAILAGEKAGELGDALQWAANAVHARLSQQLLGREYPVPPPIPSRTTLAYAVAEYGKSPAPAFRTAAATILGKLGVAETSEHVVRLLKDEEPEVRKAAVAAIADMGLKAASAQLAKALEDPNMQVRRAAVDSIVKLDLRELASAVGRLLADADTRVITTAWEALKSMGEIDVLIRRAIELLRSDNSRVRVYAAYILKDHPTTEAADALIEAMGDEVENVALTSALALADLKRPEAIPILLKFLETGDYWAARKAAETLTALGERSAAPLIRKAVEEGRLDNSYISFAEKLEP